VSAEPSSVGELATIAAERYPDRVAITMSDGSAQRTYAELEDRSTRLANALLALGLVRGDRVATWMEDRIEYVEVYLAAAKAGLVVAPINARFVAAEAEYQLQDSGAGVLVWTPGLVERVAELAPRSTPVVTISVDGSPRAADHAFENLIAEGDAMALSPPAPDDLYILGYTSGTTGRPKGAMLTHRSVLSLGRQNALSFRLSGHSIVGLTGSMSFVAVVPSHVLCLIYLGGTLVIMGRWDMPALLDAIERERITFTYIPSPLLGDFAAAARARPESLRTLHSVLHGGSRASPEALRGVFDVVGDRLVEGWGMTEHSGGLATVTTPDDYLDPDGERDVFATAGRAAVGVAIRLVDSDDTRLPHDGETIGELVIHSPSLMSGYWGRPDATADALRDGWYHTGDLGTIDADGYVVVSERRTDLIVSGGMNVYPTEVEQCIMELDDVRDAAVVGLPHERWGQTVVAAVVLAERGDLSEEEVVAHCRSRLASFKKPNRIVFLEEIPRTTSMKLARAALREQLAEALAGPA
jgi:acyl-CoA synthetase (AMP-forming)/AMP-acid ligase II